MTASTLTCKLSLLSTNTYSWGEPLNTTFAVHLDGEKVAHIQYDFGSEESEGQISVTCKGMSDNCPDHIPLIGSAVLALTKEFNRLGDAVTMWSDVFDHVEEISFQAY